MTAQRHTLTTKFARFGLAVLLACASSLFLGAKAAAPPGQGPQKAEFIGSYRWSLPDPAFGGYSGLELGQDGQSFVALSDRGTILRGKLRRNDAGAVIGVTPGPIFTLHDSRANPLNRTNFDAEGLTLLPNGRVAISFEGLHRVAVYDALDGPAGRLPRPKAFRSLISNGALEALGVDAAGTLYTLPERVRTTGEARPIWRFQNGVWDQPFTLPYAGDWQPVGMDFGPDGRMYLLERGFTFPLWFRARVRSFIVTPTGLQDARILLETRGGRHDNLEGLAVWQDSQGALRLTMISDDNFQFFQRTEWVDYKLAP